MYFQCFAHVPARWAGLVQQTDQIAASRDLSLIVRRQLAMDTEILNEMRDYFAQRVRS
jgi:hypothetical protein